MEKDSKELLSDAIAQAKKEIDQEVENHKIEDTDLDHVAGGNTTAWTISYSTVADQ